MGCGDTPLGKCLVTGAGGFLGSQLLSVLQHNGYPVRAVLRNRSKRLPAGIEPYFGELDGVGGSFSYRAALEGVDTVFHLAAMAHTVAADAQYQSDCDIALELARQAEAAGVSRLVFVSSTRAMADTGSIRRDTTWNAWPTDAYGHWKRMTEQKLLDEISIPHLAIIRPCLMYGVGVKGNLQSMIKAVSRGYFPPLPDTGAERSMVGVRDVARALLMAAGHPEANRVPLIVTDGQAYTSYGIYCEIRRALGLSPFPSFAVPVPVLKLFGLTGDIIGRIWRGCPISSDVIDRLTKPAAYSPERLCSLGWQAEKNFSDELPAIVKACLEHG